MLRSMSELKDYAIEATDGSIGRVKDFYFDDAAWVVRYLVVETGGWLSSRRVLISPIAIGTPDWMQKKLPVSITQQQVRNSPDIDTDKPVSRQHEIAYSRHFGYPFYWGGAGLWGGVASIRTRCCPATVASAHPRRRERNRRPPMRRSMRSATTPIRTCAVATP